MIYEDIDPEMRDFLILWGLRSENPEDLTEEGKAKLLELEERFKEVFDGPQ